MLAKNMMNRHAESALAAQNKVITFVGQGNVLFTMSDTKNNTRSVLGILQEGFFLNDLPTGIQKGFH